MGWDFYKWLLRLSVVWVLFLSSVDLAAKEDPDFARLRPVTVAVIDTGADLTHPLLMNRYWENSGEIGKDNKGRDKRSNNIDDDKNGFIDDVHGWDFVSNSGKITDQLGHGTHIAGIIAGHSDAETGFQGIASNARIMVIKYFDPKITGLANLRNSISALEYAIQMKVDIINYSGGGNEYSEEEEKLLQKAEKMGILLVAAAGNEKSDSDQTPFYPANYKSKNIISVAAIDRNSVLLPSSNFGKNSVNLAAPGFKVISTVPGNQMGLMTGTSQATAFVTGAAALLLGSGQNTAKQVIQILNTSVDTQPSLSRMVSSQGQLNWKRSLKVRTAQQTAFGFPLESDDTANSDLFLWRSSDTVLK